MINRLFPRVSALALLVGTLPFVSAEARAAAILDGSFEDQAVVQSNSY